MKDLQRYRVRAGTGLAVDVTAGQHVSVVDVDGGQVGDFFAFCAGDLGEHLSASHTRAATRRLFPAVGDCFFSDRRRPLLRIVADTSPGWHDLLIAACDPARYAQFGIQGWHASCAENLVQVLARRGLVIDFVPQPFNVFMRTPPAPDGSIAWLPALSGAGDRFEMEALLDLVVVLSACPSDVSGVNAGELSDLELLVESPR